MLRICLMSFFIAIFSLGCSNPKDLKFTNSNKNKIVEKAVRTKKLNAEEIKCLTAGLLRGDDYLDGKTVGQIINEQKESYPFGRSDSGVYKISSGAMIPTLKIGDYIFVSPYETNKFPKRGDIVVFYYPENLRKKSIMRIIAVEGDIIESKDKVVYVNGKSVVEPYAYHSDRNIRPANSDVRDNFGRLIIPANKVFVMGDNRDQSYDSRYWGFVDLSHIIGKALYIYDSEDKKRIGMIIE